MKLLKQALLLTEEDLTELPGEVMSTIQSNIRKGAKDLQQKWANALELVHKAYQVSQVDRPTPNMKAAWKQYEENITYAVQQLAKARTMNGDWRMSASSLHEEVFTVVCRALRESTERKFKVFYDVGDQKLEAVVPAPNIDDVVDMFTRRVKTDPETKDDPHEIKIEEDGDGVKLTFWLHGIKHNGLVKIKPM